MKNPHAKTIAIAIAALAPFAASAQDAATACATLSPQAEVLQFATKTGPKYLLVRDGDARYRVDLFQPSEGTALTSPARITAQGLPRTLCAHGKTVVKSADGRLFWAMRVAPIDTDRYERIARTLLPQATRAAQAAQAAPGGAEPLGRSDQASR